VGGAVWHLQFLEDVLVTYLTMRLKVQRPVTLEQGQAILAQERRRTLGSLMNEAKTAGLLGAQCADAFAVLHERNWLVHRSMHETSDLMYQGTERERLLVRLRTLSDRAIDLKKRLYGEVVSWMRRQGFDVALTEAVGLEAYGDGDRREPNQREAAGRDE
jgi:hypothetical protein